MVWKPPLRSATGSLFGAVLVAVVFLALCNVLHAAAPFAPETALVPYDGSKPLKSQHPDSLYIPYDRFLELWDAAKRTRRGTEPARTDATCLLESARYDGVLAEDLVTFHGVIELSTFNDPWISVPLSFVDAVVNSVQIDGVAAAFNDGNILIEKPGRHTVEVAFRIPLKRGATSFRWGIPPTPGTLVSLTLPSTRMRAVIAGSRVLRAAQEKEALPTDEARELAGAPVSVEKIVDGRKIVAATLGETAQVYVRLDSSTTLTLMTQPALAQITTKLAATRTLDLIGADFAFSFPGARQDRFTVFLDPAMALADIRAANLKSWNLTKATGRQTLEIFLNEPAKEQFSFGLRCERPGAALPAESTVPYFGAAAQRVENVAALWSGEGIELTPEPRDGFRQVVWNGDREPGMRLAGSYAFAGTPGTPAPGPAYRVRQAEFKREAHVDYVYQVDHNKVELIASLALDAKGRDLFSATVCVPAGYGVEAVRGARLAGWWLDGDTVHTRFSGATPEKTSLVVYLVRRYGAAPTKLELAPLALREFDTVKGEAVIAAHKGVAAALEISGDAKEVDPATVAKDFSILPPLERKRGFVFGAQTFRGTVALGTQAPRMNSTWVMDARVHEGWVSLSARVETSLRQGSIAALSFSLPAAFPEAHVTGPEVREVAAKIAGDRRLYSVAFQNDVYDSAGFTVDLEISATGGTAALPALEIAGQERSSGFVLVENVSEYDMSLSPIGLDPASRDEIPFLPDVIQSASLFRAHPGWALGISTVRLEKAASREAFAAWVEITTAFRVDGTEWNRAVYRLQNRSLQFLPVKLPEGAELVSVRVAGQATRADAGQVEKQDVVLVPLIKTKQGDLSFEVELVYRIPPQPRSALGSMAFRRLHDPMLVGVGVEKTLWNLYVPGDRKLGRVSGNMQPVIEEVNRTEKLAESLQELKDLACVASSKSANRLVRENANANFKQLSSQLATDMKLAKDAAKNSQNLEQKGMAPKDAVSQLSSVSKRAGELEHEFDRLRVPSSMKGRGDLAGNTYTGNTRISAGQFQMPASPLWSKNEAWAFKTGRSTQAEGSASQISRTKKGAPAAGQNLGINDYVVLNQAQDEKKPMSASVDGPDAKPQFDEAQKKWRELQQTQAFTGSFRQDHEELPEESALGTARANLAMQKVESASGRGGAEGLDGRAYGGRTELMGGKSNFLLAEAGGQTIRPRLPETALRRVGVGRGAVRSSTDAPAVAPGERVAAAAAAVDDSNALHEPEQGLPHPSGRISLPVDFPTEGEAAHFKKLKSNATLEVWIEEPAAYEHWYWAGRFVLLALALAATGFVLDRFAKRAE